MIERVALRLLGTHVERRAHRDARLRDAHIFRFEVAAQAEVGDLHPPLARQQDVLGLDVTMDEAGFARRADRLRGLPHDRESKLQFNRALFQDVVAQVRSLHKLHCDEVCVVNTPKRINMNNTRVIKPRDGRRFQLEPVEILLIGREVGPENLECDRAIQAELSGEIDLAHPASTEQPLDLEIAQCDSRQIDVGPLVALGAPSECVFRWLAVRGTHDEGLPFPPTWNDRDRYAQRPRSLASSLRKSSSVGKWQINPTSFERRAWLPDRLWPALRHSRDRAAGSGSTPRA